MVDHCSNAAKRSARYMLYTSFLLLPSILDGRKEQHISIKLNAREKGVSFMPIEKLPEAKLSL
jgi:hypothetical protein